MINGVNSGFQQQAPASAAFQPGQAPNNPANTPQVQQGPQAPPQAPASVQSGQTEEINSQVALSRDTARINPSQISNNSQQRGQALDVLA